MTDPAEAVRALYGTPALRPLFAAARRRLEERDLDLGGVVTLRSLAPEERAAIGRILGSARPPGDDARVALADLDAALRRQATGLGLAEVLEALEGPLVARREARRQRADARDATFEDARLHPALERHPALADWLDRLRARGTLTRLDRGRRVALLRQALDVLAAVPTEPVSLPVLAGRTTGGTHSLDRGTPLAALVDGGLAVLAGEDPTPPRRELWARVGVTIDAVSSTAIVLGLRPRSGPLAALLNAAADAGEPLHVTLRMLRDTNAINVGGALVSLCENRSVIEAVADQLGAAAAPLVCLSGEPAAAGRRLVAALASGGARLRYHGDFDADGIAIANSVIGGRVEPWRYGADDYLAAVGATAVRDELDRKPVFARWDARLSGAMADAGARIYEEHVLEDLLTDLRTGR